MSHLTEEQFEDILQGRAEVPEHVDRCPRCRAYLDEKRALVRRVAQAFSSVHASPGLAARIQAHVTAAGRPAAVAKTRSRVISLQAYRAIGPGLAVAAALIIIAVLRSPYVDPVSRARAAQTALVGIHRINLDSLDELRNDVRAGRRCQCLEGKLDGSAMPCCKRELCRCGCRMRDFQGRLVPSCVIEEPNAVPVSVVVVPGSPQALGMTVGRATTATGQAIWQASCGPCNMASVRLGEESCCVIGHVPPEDLVAVLNAFDQ
jgi:hypothetical protein